MKLTHLSERFIHLMNRSVALRLHRTALLVAGGLLLSAASSSGSVYLSTLDLPPTTGAMLQHTQWTGVAFTTDDSPYRFEGITARLNFIDTPPVGDLQPALYLANLSNLPDGAPLSTSFSSSAWVTGVNDYLFSATESIILEANTTYIFALRPTTLTSSGLWQGTAASNPYTGPWTMPVVFAVSHNNGSTWSDASGGVGRLLIEINATAVPEPGTVALIGLGGVLGLLHWRRRR